MTIWISRELSLINLEHQGILCARMRHPCEKLWPFEFLESFRCSISSVSISYVPESDILVKSYDHWNFSRASIVQFLASRYIMSPNGTFVRKVMTIWISRELSRINFERPDMFCAWTVPSSEKLWQFEFPESFRCSISNVSIYWAPYSDIWVKSYDHLNFMRASVVQFWASRYIMSPFLTSVWKAMTIWISWELPLFNFVPLDMLWAWIGDHSEKLWPFEFLESPRWSI